MTESQLFHDEIKQLIQDHWVAAHPNLRLAEVILVLSQMVGYGIGACFKDQRDAMRELALMQMDQATADYLAQLQPGEDRSSVTQ